MDDLHRGIDDLIARRIADGVAHLDVAGAPALAVPEGVLDVDVLVPVHGAYDVISRCLHALAAHTPHAQRLILIDDGNDDARIVELFESLAAKHPNVEMRSQSVNIGYLRTVNDAISRSRRDVVLLNSDAEVGPGWLEALWHAAHSAPAIGIASPLSDNATLLTIVDRQRLAGVDAASLRALVAATSAGDCPRIPVAAGFCMYVRREVFDTIGVFDPAFDPGYGEETDFSMRATRAGFEIVACTGALVLHASGASFGTRPEVLRRRRLHERLMALRWPGYEPMVRAWWREWPMREQSECIAASLSGSRARVLHVVHARSRIGGTELHTRALVRSLASKFDNTLVAPEQVSSWQDAGHLDRGAGWEERFVNKRYHVANHRIAGIGADISDPGVERQFLRMLVGGGYGIVHFHSLLNWNSLLLPFLAKEAGARIVLTPHSLESLCPHFTMAPAPQHRACGQRFAGAGSACVECIARVRSLRRDVDAPDLRGYLDARHYVWKRIFEIADAVIAPSRFVLDRLAAAFGDSVLDRAHIVAHGLATAVHPRERAVATSPLRIGFLGGVSPTKGVQLVLEIAAALGDAPVHFVLHGIAARRYLPARLPANVECHGVFSPATVSDILHDLDLVLIPGQAEETWSLVLSECLAAGVPVIASRRGALIERISHGETGWLKDPDRPGEWIEQIRRLTTVGGRADLARVAARIRDREPRTIEQNADDYARIYEALLAKPSARARSPLVGTKRARDSITASLRERQQVAQASVATPWLDYERPAPPDADDHNGRIGALVRVSRHNAHLVSQTLQSLFAASAHARAFVVVDDDASGEIADVWRDSVSLFRAGDPAVRTRVLESDADWLVDLEAGDELAPSALAWLGRARADTHAIAADFDLVDERGAHYGAVAQSPWDPWRALVDASYSQALFVPARTWRRWFAGDDDAGRDRLRMQLRLRADGVSADSLHRVLVHVADINVSPSHRDCVRDAHIVSVRDALARDAPTRWSIADRGASPGWRVTPAVSGAPTVAILVWGAADVPQHELDPLAARLDWPGLTIRPMEALTELPVADYLLLWRWGTARASAETPLLPTLIGWLQQDGVAAVGPRRELERGEPAPRSYRFDGTAIDRDADPREAPHVFGDGLCAHTADASALFADCLLVRRTLVARADLDVLAAAESSRSWHTQQRWRERHPWLLHVSDALVRCTSVPPQRVDGTATSSDRIEIADASLRRQFRRRPGASSTGLRKTRPRFAVLTRDDWASSQYRAHQPMRELFEQGRIEAPITWRTRRERVPGLFDILAEDVDGIVLHHALDDRSIELVRGLARRQVGPRVFVLDDLLEALPPYNPLKRRVPTDVRERIARVLEHCTCLVTTSEALADAWHALAPRVIVIENALPDRPWFDPAAPKRSAWRAGRPRVGWAGAGQHAGDLASIEALVRARRDVQWVFMGMAPNGAREAGAEIHDAVPFHEYPERLAALDLDLALAPLVDNAFNRCKSALKVIELGALGVPVIASDLRPYRDTHAILVADDARAWNAAIDEWAFDFERCRAKGNELRAWVLASHRLSQRAPLWMNALEFEHAGPTTNDPAAAPPLHRAAQAVAPERATA